MLLCCLQAAEQSNAPKLKAVLLAEAAAFGQVDHHRVGQVRRGRAVGGPLELLMALVHVVEEVLHPEERVSSVSHHASHLWLRPRRLPSRRRRRAVGVEC